MFWIIFCLIFWSFVLILGRILFVILKKDEKSRSAKSQRVKTLVVLGSGGHTTEILRIVENLNKERYEPRIYIYANSDKISPSKVKEIETNDEEYELKEISRSREVGQSYFTSVLTTLVSFKDSFLILRNYEPRLILCNGPGTCVPICFAAFFNKVFLFQNTTVIFVESFCRTKTFSLSGKILYYIADHIVVQWPQLYNSKKKNLHLIK